MIYVFQLGHLPFVKVGFSDNPSNRSESLQQGLPLILQTVATMEGSRVYEGSIHKKLSRWRTRGEWYAVTPDFVTALEVIFGCSLAISVVTDDVDLTVLFTRREREQEQHQRELEDRDAKIDDLERRLRGDDGDVSMMGEIRRTMAEAESAVARMEDAANSQPDGTDGPSIEERLEAIEQTLTTILERLPVEPATSKKIPRRPGTC